MRSSQYKPSLLQYIPPSIRTGQYIPPSLQYIPPSMRTSQYIPPSFRRAETASSSNESSSSYRRLRREFQANIVDPLEFPKLDAVNPNPNEKLQ